MRISRDTSCNIEEGSGESILNHSRINPKDHIGRVRENSRGVSLVKSDRWVMKRFNWTLQQMWWKAFYKLFDVCMSNWLNDSPGVRICLSKDSDREHHCKFHSFIPYCEIMSEKKKGKGCHLYRPCRNFRFCSSPSWGLVVMKISKVGCGVSFQTDLKTHNTIKCSLNKTFKSNIC